MRSVTVVSGLVALTLAVAASSFAQSLGDAARKEEERRKARAKPAKVITEDDIGRSGGTIYAPTEATAPAGEEKKDKPAEGEKKAEKKEKTEDELRAEAQTAWRTDLDSARRDVSELTAEAERIQTGLNDVNASLYGQGRADQVARLEDIKGKLAAAQQKVSDLEDKGRRNGYR